MSLRQNFNLLKLSLRHYRITQKKAGHLFDRLFKKKNNFPKLLRFFLFSGCNFRCRMCGQWGLSGTSKPEEIKNFLPLQKLCAVIDEAAKFRPEIYVWGGEPSLHPDFARFIAYVKQKRLVCTINTNGYLLEKYGAEILESKVDSLDVSLIGTEKIHDYIVQVSGAYQQVMKGLKILAAAGKNKRPLIKAIITISADNINDIENLIGEIENNPAIDLSVLQLGWFVAPRAGQAYEERMNREFAVKAASWQGFSDEKAGERAEKIQQLVARVRKSKKYRKPILLFPDIKTAEIARYYTDHGVRFGRKECWAIYRELDIRPNGDAVVCADYPDYIMGNVNSQTIKEIWQGEKMSKFRQSIAQNGLLPICSRCCGLFR